MLLKRYKKLDININDSKESYPISNINDSKESSLISNPSKEGNIKSKLDISSPLLKRGEEDINSNIDININNIDDINIDNIDSFLTDFSESQLPPKTLGLMFRYAAHLRKTLPHREMMQVLRFVNKEFMEDPLPAKSFFNLSNSLKDHIDIDIKPIADRALEYLRMVDSAAFRDIKDYCRESSEIVTKALDMLRKEEWVVKHRNEYRLIIKIEWEDKIGSLGELLDFKVPLFDDRQYWRWGDILLIGAKTGTGKTAICMNMIRELVNNGVKPYYVPTEIGGRHGRVARTLGLGDGDYFYPADPIIHAENIKLEQNSITFIDWLLPKDYSETDKLFQLFAQKMARIRGFLVIFMQLKDYENEWYAPSMCKMFPSFATKYILNKDRKGGVFKIEKIREAKGIGSYENIPCVYDFDTKVISLVDLGNKSYQEVMKKFEGEVV